MISEFGASNLTSIEDGYGDNSDWIEIYNSGDSPVDLRGYRLTDDPSEPEAWSFKDSTTIQPESHLLVFASGNDLVDPRGFHHTNFKLSAGGEYLGLFDDTGTLLSEYGTATEDYPKQFTDISYGFSATGAPVSLVTENSPSQYWVPDNGTLGTTWTENNFDAVAAGFVDGQAAIGYEATPGGSTDYTDEILTDVPLGTTSAYVRTDFEITDTSDVATLTLNLKYDDGVAVYLNGTFLFSRFTDFGLNWNSTASGGRSDSEALTFESFGLDGSVGSEGDFLSLLVNGRNTLAIHALNASSNSSDFLMVPELHASFFNVDQTLGYLPPTPGQFNSQVIQPGPEIKDVTPSATPINPGETLTVTAEVSDFDQPLDPTSVRLHYRIMFEDEISVPMTDDGLQADLVANDGIFSGLLDSSAVPAGQMVRWYVTATDIAGSTARAPRFLNPIDSAEYFGTVITDPTIDTDLPLLQWFVENPNASLTRAGTRASLFYNGQFYDNIKVDVHGQSTSGFPKKSFDFDSNAGEKFLVSNGVGRASDFNLMTNYADQTKVRHPLAYELFTEASTPALKGFPVTVHQNGNFYGLYDLLEEGDEEYLDRVGLDRNGSLFKINNRLSSSTAAVERKSRNHEDNSELEPLINANVTLTGLDAETWDFDNLDLADTVNYLATQAVLASADFGHKNMYWYRDTEGTGLWTVLPWDLDLSLGHTWLSHYFDNEIRAEIPLDWNTGLWTSTLNNLFRRVLDHPRTSEMFFRRLKSLSDQFYGQPGTPTSNSYVAQRVNQIEALIADESIQDMGAWGVAPPYASAYPFNPAQAVDQLHDVYIDARRDFINNDARVPDSQVGIPAIVFDTVDFDASPDSGLQSEEYVRLNNPTDTAIDISGWKLTEGIEHTFKGGTVIEAGGSLYVAADIVAFKNRTEGPRGGERRFIQGNYQGQLINSGETVNLVMPDDTAVDVLVTPDDGGTENQAFLRVSEINYNPGDTGAEYIEFLNTSSGSTATTLNLAGVTISEGPSDPFVFADGTTLEPGQRLVVVKDMGDFTDAYPGVDPSLIAGDYTGSLSNSGETIRIDDTGGEKLLEFTYNDSDPWAIAADGVGSSLQLVAETTTPLDLLDKYYSWRASYPIDGTPTAPPASPNPTVVINEILAHTDLPQVDYVELHNTHSAAINVGGWYLSDAKSNLLKYQIPADTVIEANGYLIIDESDFNPTPATPGPNDFALSSTGDQVWLTIAQASQPIAIVDVADFEATANGISIGRAPNGSGRLAPQASISPNAANKATKIGPLLLTEVHYHPADPTPIDLMLDPTLSTNDLEFVEVHNLSSADVNTTDWSLSGIADFTFPVDTIGGGETWVLVSFDPNDPTNANKLNAFKNHYGIGDAVRIVGDFSGKLSNSFGRVTLGNLEGLVDEIVYDDRSPWPNAADGDGSSLQRTAGNLSGNRTESWTADLPTPGSVALAQVGPKAIALVRDDSSVRRPDLMETLSFTFDADVNIDAEDLILLNDTTGGTPVDLDGAVFAYDAVNFRATWDFGGLATPLPPAYYTLTLPETITGAGSGLNLDGDSDGSAGGDMDHPFYVAIPGDVNLDGDVDASDFDFVDFENKGDLFLVRQNMGKEFATWADGDFNGDGDVDASEFDFSTFTNVGDLFIVRQHLGQNVVPPPATPLATPLLQNPANQLDVNDDGSVSPLDALLVINELNRPSGRLEGESSESVSRYPDVNGDSQTTPIDALLVINALNRRTRTSQIEAESQAALPNDSSGSVESNNSTVVDTALVSLDREQSLTSDVTPLSNTNVEATSSPDAIPQPVSSEAEDKENQEEDVLTLLADNMLNAWN